MTLFALLWALTRTAVIVGGVALLLLVIALSSLAVLNSESPEYPDGD